MKEFQEMVLEHLAKITQEVTEVKSDVTELKTDFSGELRAMSPN